MDCTNDLIKSQGFFDVIVCDPPYGIRAGARESGLREARVKRKEFKAKQISESKEEGMEDEKIEESEEDEDEKKKGISFVLSLLFSFRQKPQIWTPL